MQKFFAEPDSTFRGRTAMVVRSRAARRVGPYMLKLESSCGTERHRVKGSARIIAIDCRSVDAKAKVKRFGVDSWREALGEFDRITEIVRRGG